MRKIIALVVLVALIGVGIYVARNPGAMESGGQDILAQDTESITNFVTDKLVTGKLMNVLPAEQIEKAAAAAKNSGLINGENPVIKGFLDYAKMSLEEFLAQLKDKKSIMALREQFMIYLSEEYCEKNGITAQEADPMEVLKYQTEKVSSVVREVVRKLKEADK